MLIILDETCSHCSYSFWRELENFRERSMLSTSSWKLTTSMDCSWYTVQLLKQCSLQVGDVPDQSGQT